MFADVSKIMTENDIDIQMASSRVSKQGTATIELSFEVSSIDEVQRLIGKVMQIPGVIDVQRGAG